MDIMDKINLTLGTLNLIGCFAILGIAIMKVDILPTNLVILTVPAMFATFYIGNSLVMDVLKKEGLA